MLLLLQGRPRYVVTGLVSGGRGLLSYCGGINNPTHYVRWELSSWVTDQKLFQSQEIRSLDC